MDGRAPDGPADAGTPCPHRWRHLENLEKIGQGISGEVYRAWDSLLQRDVALKLSRRTGDFSDSCSLFALREARLLARIRHPNVVTVYGVDHAEQRLGVWMEYIHGLNLDAVLRHKGPMGARKAAVIGLDLCSAVSAAHEVGLLHGDITTKNVMRDRTGRIVLLDFGFSQDLGALHSSEWEYSICGTPLYMAPEILCGGRPSVRSDIYSMGVLLYRLATGQFPVEGHTMAEVREALNEGCIRLLRDRYPYLGKPFIATVDRSIAIEPAARFATVIEMAQSLRGSL
jgi:serine/threonine-protein kinase